MISLYWGEGGNEEHLGAGRLQEPLTLSAGDKLLRSRKRWAPCLSQSLSALLCACFFNLLNASTVFLYASQFLAIIIPRRSLRNVFRRRNPRNKQDLASKTSIACYLREQVKSDVLSIRKSRKNSLMFGHHGIYIRPTMLSSFRYCTILSRFPPKRFVIVLRMRLLNGLRP